MRFQVAHTTISPNYPREEFETPDRQILVVSADVPPQDGETDEQRQECENANAARTIRRQQELAIAASGVGQPPANSKPFHRLRIAMSLGIKRLLALGDSKVIIK
jgi:hypothetical protein